METDSEQTHNISNHHTDAESASVNSMCLSSSSSSTLIPPISTIAYMLPPHCCVICQACIIVSNYTIQASNIWLTSYSSTILVVLATNIKRGGHNEIHNVENSREALPSQVFPVVGKSKYSFQNWVGWPGTNTNPGDNVSSAIIAESAIAF